MILRDLMQERLIRLVLCVFFLCLFNIKPLQQKQPVHNHLKVLLASSIKIPSWIFIVRYWEIFWPYRTPFRQLKCPPVSSKHSHTAAPPATLLSAAAAAQRGCLSCCSSCYLKQEHQTENKGTIEFSLQQQFKTSQHFPHIFRCVKKSPFFYYIFL